MKRYLPSLTAASLVILVVLVCAGAYYGFTHSLHASIIYHLEARFDALPPDDKALKIWIESQPGIVPQRVWVNRFNPDKKLVAVMFIQVRNLAGEPPIPDLDAACAQLGYAGRDGPFHVSEENRAFGDQ